MNAVGQTDFHNKNWTLKESMLKEYIVYCESLWFKTCKLSEMQSITKKMVAKLSETD